jgi:hypothetical protein
MKLRMIVDKKDQNWNGWPILKSQVKDITVVSNELEKTLDIHAVNFLISLQ